MEYMRFKNASLSILLQNDLIKDDEVRYFFSTKIFINRIIFCAKIMVYFGNQDVGFFFLKLLIYLFGCIGLSCGMWDLSLQCTDSLVVARMFSSWGTRASCFEACGVLVP